MSFLLKKTFCLLPGLFLVMLINLNLYGQERELTLDELIEVGMERATPYQTELLQKRNVQSNLLTTYYDFLPSMSVGTTRNYSDVDTKSAGFSLYKGISLNEPTYFNWRRARLDKQNAELSYAEIRRQTAFDVFSLYIRVLEAEKRSEIQDTNLEIQEKIFQQVETLYELDQRSLIDLRQSQIALINAQIAKETSINSYRQSRESLFHYLGIDDPGYALREPDIEIKAIEYDYEPPTNLQRAEIELKKSSVSLTQTRLDFLPNINLSYSYNYRYPGPSVTDDLYDFSKYEDSYTISLNVSYSLLNPLRQREVYSRTRRNFRVQEMHLDDMSDQAELQFKQMMRDWENEKRIHSMAEQRYELAGESMEMAEQQFELGLMSLLELDQARKDYLEAQIDLNSRNYQLLVKQEEINLFLSNKILDRWE